MKNASEIFKQMPDGSEFFKDADKEQSVGMYEIGNKDWPQIKVGGFVIALQDDNSVWIQEEDGDGGQFSNESFEEIISEFYNKNF